MLDLRAGYARNGFDRSPISNGFDITSLGLSPVLASQAQVQHFPTVDWAHFGKVKVGRAERRLSCFVSTLSYSRALYLEFFFDQMLESFLRGHVRTFQDWGGVQ